MTHEFTLVRFDKNGSGLHGHDGEKDGRELHLAGRREKRGTGERLTPNLVRRADYEPSHSHLRGTSCRLDDLVTRVNEPLFLKKLNCVL